MSEKEPEEQPKNLEEQFKEILRKANISFVMGQPPSAEAEPKAAEEAPEEAHERLKAIREFSLKPRDIRDYLDRFVVRQDEAKKVLSVAICDHYNHVRRCVENPEFAEREYAKHNIVLLGPTGVGKTYLMRCIAKLIGVPMVKADATKFTETGYVGHDVEDLVRDLVKAADGDTELAQYGIIFLDEIDKIASAPTVGGKDVSGRGVQINLLKLMEETDVSLFSQTDLIGQVQVVMEMQRGKGPHKRTINTRHMLFIVSGAFDSLADQVQQRVSVSKIGFTQDKDKELSGGDYLRLAETGDFIEYGFEPEFVGRLPIRVVCDSLSAGDLEDIMVKSEGSILDQYRYDFEGYGINFRVQPDAISEIAQQAHAERTGARGLMTVLERLLRDFKFELPSTAIKAFDINKKVISDSKQAITALLSRKESARRESLQEEVARFSKRFLEEQGLKLVLTPDAVEAIVETCIAENESVETLFATRFHDFEYGLKLISRNSGRTSFKITKKFVSDPARELSRRIARSFRKGG